MTRPRRLPAGPLLAAIDRHPAVRKPESGWEKRLRLRAGKAAASVYRDTAAGDGWVTLRAVERLCDAFGWHPRQVYGDAYDHAAFAGRPPNFDPWQGVA